LSRRRIDIEEHQHKPTTMKTTLHFLIVALLLLVSAPLTFAAVEDQEENCVGWAEQGECSLNPKYMQENW